MMTPGESWAGKCRNFFIGLYDEKSNKYFFPYFEDETDSIETTGVSSAYDESLETTLYDLSGTLTDYVLYRLKEDMQPIGVHREEKDFTTQVIKLQDRDSL